MGSSANHQLVDILKEPPADGIWANFIQGVSDGKRRILNDVRFVWAKLQPYTHRRYVNVTQEVLQSERVQQGIEQAVQADLHAVTDETEISEESCRKLREKHTQSAKSHLETMNARYNVPFIRMFAYFLLKVFKRLLSGIIVSPNQLKQLRCAHKGEVPIIYLPLHRSHLDYLVISFVLWCWDMPMPHIASGDNLNLSGLGWVLRSLGAFFIRRRMEPEGTARKDTVYRAVLHSYMTALLENGQSIEFFAEGTRSRTGKTVMPKSGLMAVVVQAYDDARIKDAILVPVATTYERTLEGTYTREQTGAPKVRESVWQVMSGIWTAIGTQYGNVKVDIGAPVFLSELLASVQPLTADDTVGSIESGCDTTTPVDLSPSLSSSVTPVTADRSTMSLRSIGSEGGKGHRQLVDSVTRHLVFESERLSALTPASLLSTLLLSKYRHDCISGDTEGVWLADLESDLDWLCRLAIRKGDDDEGRDVIGYLPGQTDVHEVIQRAVELFDSGLVELKYTGKDVIASYASSDSGYCDRDTPPIAFNPNRHGVLSVPNADWLNLVSLAYYRNAVAPVFALEAVLSATLLSYRLDMGLGSGGALEDGVLFEDVLDRALGLAEMLKYELLFIKPCQSLREELTATLEWMSFSNLALIHITNKNVGFGTPMYCSSASARETALITIRDDWFRPNCSEEVLELFASLIIGPVECYARLFQFVHERLPNKSAAPISERVLLKEFVNEKRASTMHFEESLTGESARNGLKLLCDRRVLQRILPNKVPSYTLLDGAHLVELTQSLAPIFI